MATEVVCFWGIAPFFISEVAEIIEKSTWPQVMTLLIVLYWKRFGLKTCLSWESHPNSLIEKKMSPHQPATSPLQLKPLPRTLAQGRVTDWWTRGGIFWNWDPGSPCFYAVRFFGGNRAPTDIKKNLSQSAEKPQGGQGGSPSGGESAPRRIHWRSNWVKCPLPCKPEKFPDTRSFTR